VTNIYLFCKLDPSSVDKYSSIFATNQVVETANQVNQMFRGTYTTGHSGL